MPTPQELYAARRARENEARRRRAAEKKAIVDNQRASVVEFFRAQADSATASATEHAHQSPQQPQHVPVPQVLLQQIRIMQTEEYQKTLKSLLYRLYSDFLCPVFDLRGGSVPLRRYPSPTRLRPTCVIYKFVRYPIVSLDPRTERSRSSSTQ